MRAGRQPSKLDSCMGHALLILLCAVFSPAMLYLGIASLGDEHDLDANGVIVKAAVIGSSVDVENGTEVYHLKYRFSVDGGKTWYYCSDRTGRQNIWCSVTKEQWLVTRVTRLVDVIYLPDKPWVNRPVYSTIGAGDSWAGVCLGVCPWLLYLFYFISRMGNKQPDHEHIGSL